MTHQLMQLPIETWVPWESFHLLFPQWLHWNGKWCRRLLQAFTLIFAISAVFCFVSYPSHAVNAIIAGDLVDYLLLRVDGTFFQASSFLLFFVFLWLFVFDLLLFLFLLLLAFLVVILHFGYRILPGFSSSFNPATSKTIVLFSYQNFWFHFSSWTR